MNEKSLATLAATSPKIAFRTFREAHEKITTLETALGLPPGKPIVNIGRATARISELENMVALVAAVPAVPAAPVAAAPVAPVVEKFGRERFTESCRRDAAKKPQAQNHPELHGRERFAAASKVSYK